MPETPVIVYSAANRAQAYLLMDWLREHGIEAQVVQVVNDSLEVAGGDLPLGWASAPKLVVPESQANKAKPLLEQFEARARDQRESPDPPPDDLTSWPACPRCGTHRPTRCPHCGTTGDQFEQAWLGRTSSEEFLVVCSTCDEPFHPEFYRICHRCQHDFGAGLSPPKVQPQKPDHEPFKVWLALGGVFLAIAGLLGYFVWLFAR